MDSIPQLWIVAGPNGAGKTTCVQGEPIASILPRIPFANPDDRTLEKLRAGGYSGFADAPLDVQSRCFLESADEVYAELHSALSAGESVGVETVLSSDKYRALVDSVNEARGIFGLIYVALSSPAISQVRIAERVRRGGHGVPVEKLAARWQRSLDNLAWFVRRATGFWVLDNSDSGELGPKLIAHGKQGRLDFVSPDCFPEMKAALATIPFADPAS